MVRGATRLLARSATSAAGSVQLCRRRQFRALATILILPTHVDTPSLVMKIDVATGATTERRSRTSPGAGAGFRGGKRSEPGRPVIVAPPWGPSPTAGCAYEHLSARLHGSVVGWAAAHTHYTLFQITS